MQTINRLTKIIKTLGLIPLLFVMSNMANAEITDLPLFEDSVIFGTVYVDSNNNGEQDKGERGISGVKLVTGSGEIVTTDQDGRYSIAGVNGGRFERGTNFILKLDESSMPNNYKLLSSAKTVVRLSSGLPSKIDFRLTTK